MDNKISSKKTTNKIITIIGIIIHICSLVFSGIYLYATFSHRMEYIEPTIGVQRVKIVECYTDSQEQLKKDVDNLFGSPFYFFCYSTHLDSDVLGQTNIYLRKVTVAQNLSSWKFVFTLAHELVHLTQFTGSERYCHTIAFEKLWFSGNDYFKYVATCWFNADILGGVSFDYSFAGYVEKYFK